MIIILTNKKQCFKLIIIIYKILFLLNLTNGEDKKNIRGIKNRIQKKKKKKKKKMKIIIINFNKNNHH